MTVKIDGTNGIDTAQLRAPDGDPVAITISGGGVVAFPSTPNQQGIVQLAPVDLTGKVYPVIADNLPAGVKRISIVLLSATFGADYPVLELGSAAAWKQTAYNSVYNQTSNANATAGAPSVTNFILGGNTSISLIGAIELVKNNNNVWTESAILYMGTTFIAHSCGDVDLGETLTRLRLGYFASPTVAILGGTAQVNYEV